MANPTYPVSEKVYASVDDLPNDGVAYNVAIMNHSYTENAGKKTILVKGAKNTLTISDAKSVTDTVQVTDTNSEQINIGQIISKLPITGAFTHTHSEQYTNGTTTTFTQNSAIEVTPKTEDLTATPVYYRAQLSGDRYLKENGKARQVNIQPNSFNADITYAQGWELLRKDGTKAKSGVDY